MVVSAPLQIATTYCHLIEIKKTMDVVIPLDINGE